MQNIDRTSHYNILNFIYYELVFVIICNIEEKNQFSMNKYQNIGKCCTYNVIYR